MNKPTTSYTRITRLQKVFNELVESHKALIVHHNKTAEALHHRISAMETQLKVLNGSTTQSKIVIKDTNT